MRISFTALTALALIVGGHALADSSINYTLELGGDNHAGAWENMDPNTIYGRATNGDQDDQSIDIGKDVNWAVVVDVTGQHNKPGGMGDGNLTGGAANLVFDLELKKDGNTVAIVAGSPASQGWYSTINDGDDDGLRGTVMGADDRYNAAYAVAFNIDGKMGLGGYLLSPPASGGPNMDFAHYPSASGWPAASTADPGKLIGMGAGYKEFKPITGGGACTGGVGLSEGSYSCSALGKLPLFEGQINTTGLDPGTYTLVLTASTGNNVLPDRAAIGMCDLGPTGQFAVAPNAVNGDQIRFILKSTGPTCVAPVMTAAASKKVHGTAGTFSIDLLAAGATECRKNGATTVEVTFDRAIALVTGTPADVAVTSGSVTAVAAAGSVLTVTCSGMTNNAKTTMTFPGVADGQTGCSAFVSPSSLCIRNIKGDSASGFGAVNVIDLNAIKNQVNIVVTGSNFRCDVDATGKINVLDLNECKNNINKTVGACP